MKFESWWDKESQEYNRLQWTCSYPVDDKTKMYVWYLSKRVILERGRSEPYWVGISEQVWAINNGFADDPTRKKIRGLVSAVGRVIESVRQYEHSTGKKIHLTESVIAARDS